MAAREKALVDALIASVRETLKMEAAAAAVVEVEVPFGTHKLSRTAKVFPYLSFFDKFVFKEWEHSKCPFAVPKCFAVRYPFEESLLKLWTTPPVADTPVSRLNKATMIPF